MRLYSVVLLGSLAVVACSKPEAPAQKPGTPAPMMAQPGSVVKGKVVERIDAAPYSYLKLATAEGEAWAAVPQTTVANGTEVTVGGAMPMDGFESKTLKRKFDKIYFGTLGGSEAGPGAGPGAPTMPAAMGMPGGPAGMAQQHAAAATGPVEVGDVKVSKASGADARTVAEVFAQKSKLKEKPVTIHGKVVKFSPDIMGRNWLHLRDGSGAQGDNDLTVTTTDHVAVGEVVIAKGTVRLDKDFGAGYAYPVIVEDAKVTK